MRFHHKTKTKSQIAAKINTAMDQIEERLAEEVRKYEHLYNSSLKEYKDSDRHPPIVREIQKVHDCVEEIAWPHSNAVIEVLRLEGDVQDSNARLRTRQ